MTAVEDVASVEVATQTAVLDFAADEAACRRRERAGAVAADKAMGKLRTPLTLYTWLRGTAVVDVASNG